MKKTISIFFIYLLAIPLVINLIFSWNNLLASTITVIIQILFLFFNYKNSIINDFKNFKIKYLKTALIKWCLLFISMLVLNMIIISIVGDASSNESSQRSIIAIHPILCLITIGLLGPISEELAFRKNFKEGIKNKKYFLIISSLIFGFAHLISGFADGTVFTNPLELLFILPYASMGYFFASAYLKTNNIFTSTIMHIFHNIITIVIIIGG